MTPLDRISADAATEKLGVFGLLHARPEDGIGGGTIVLLGPDEPGFWSHVTAAPEFVDGLEDPIDRWSARVIGAIATRAGGMPLFPFGDPVRPFIGWALRSGRAWSAPVGLLVHDTAGLMVSYRGAVLLPETLDLPRTGPSPCNDCETRPCLTACPVSALGESGYDLAACHAFLDTQDGQECMSRGCSVRRSCPAGQSYRRVDAQSAYHMERFHP